MTNKNANYVCGSYMPGRNISKRDIEKIDFKVITHVFLAFSLLEIDENGNYVPVISEPLKKGIALVLNHIKEIGADTKVLVSIGGYGAGGFCETASAKDSRKAFAKKCAEILDEHKIDGIDMDWEYPTIAYEDEGVNACENCDKDFVLLMEEIKKAIGTKLLTAAVGSDHWYMFDLERLNKSVDYINVMTYDMNQTAHSSMELTKSAVEGWGNGIDRNKVVLGVPFYARCTNEKYEWKGYSELMGLVENKTAEMLYTDDRSYIEYDGSNNDITSNEKIMSKVKEFSENSKEKDANSAISQYWILADNTKRESYINGENTDFPIPKKIAELVPIIDRGYAIHRENDVFLSAVIEKGSTKRVVTGHNHCDGYEVSFDGITYTSVVKTGSIYVDKDCDMENRGGSKFVITNKGDKATVTSSAVYTMKNDYKSTRFPRPVEDF